MLVSCTTLSSADCPQTQVCYPTSHHLSWSTHRQCKTSAGTWVDCLVTGRKPEPCIAETGGSLLVLGWVRWGTSASRWTDPKISASWHLVSRFLSRNWSVVVLQVGFWSILGGRSCTCRVWTGAGFGWCWRWKSSGLVTIQLEPILLSGSEEAGSDILL